jgi:hypothetical protein
MFIERHAIQSLITLTALHALFVPYFAILSTYCSLFSRENSLFTGRADFRHCGRLSVYLLEKNIERNRNIEQGPALFRTTVSIK